MHPTRNRRKVVNDWQHHERKKQIYFKACQIQGVPETNLEAYAIVTSVSHSKERNCNEIPEHISQSW